MGSRRLTSLPWFALAVLLTQPLAFAGTGAGATVFQNGCVACHGSQGQGNETLEAPALAGLPGWYVLSQLNNFREGRRGISAAEPQAMIMAAMVKALAPDSLESVARHVEQLPPTSAASVPDALRKPDLAQGRQLYEERCMECHRYNASGEVVFGSPPLAGRQEWYLRAQIEKFKNGRRGTAPGDQNGAKMVLAARFIEDEKAAQSVVAYILTLSPAAQPGEAFGSDAPAMTTRGSAK